MPYRSASIPILHGLESRTHPFLIKRASSALEVNQWYGRHHYSFSFRHMLHVCRPTNVWGQASTLFAFFLSAELVGDGTIENTQVHYPEGGIPGCFRSRANELYCREQAISKGQLATPSLTPCCNQAGGWQGLLRLA